MVVKSYNTYNYKLWMFEYFYEQLHMDAFYLFIMSDIHCVF